jgi:hypothetical protein
MSALAATRPAAGAPPSPSGERPGSPYAAPLMVLGLIMIAFTLGRALRRRRRAALRASEETLQTARSAPARGAASAASAAPAAQAREMCEAMIADLARTAREVNAQLETRIRVLECLIRQADERIARLGGTAGDEPQRAPADGAAPPSAPRSAPSAPEPVEEARHAPVYRLAEEGLSVREIAQRTGLGQGEVELLLNLRRGRGA